MGRLTGLPGAWTLRDLPGRLLLGVVALLLLLLVHHCAEARTILVPPTVLPGQTPRTVELRIDLVDADGDTVVGELVDDCPEDIQMIVGTGTHVAGVAAPAATELELTPQDCIDGTTYWQISTRVGIQTVRWPPVQIPSGSTDLTWSEVWGLASAVQRDQTYTGRLLPDVPDGAAAGWGLVLSGDPLAAVWSAAAGGGCTTLACLLDGPAGYGTSGQAITSTGTGWQWSTPASAATWGSITGTISAQTDLTPAAIGAATATQGSQGATAYGWGNHASAGYLTAAPVTSVAGRTGAITLAAADVSGVATSSQGALADSAVQPGDDAADLGSATAADSYVLTADGAGGAAWEAVSGTGGHDPVTISDTSTVDLSLTGQQISAAVIQSGLTLSSIGGSVTDSQVPNNITIDLAGTATALAANGANCAAGSYPLGVDASGAVESCTDATTEIDAAIGTHAGAADPHPGYLLESAAGDAALLDVGTTAGTVAAGNDSRFTDSRTPTAHASTHADGGSDEISIDGSQITSGSVPTARAPAGTYYEWIELPLTPVGGTLTAADLIVADVPYAGTITAARVACQTAPTVSAASIDLRRNAAWGSTPASVLSSAISLGSGSFEASGTISSGTLTADDVLAGYVSSADGGGTAANCILTVSITRTAP